MSLRSPIVPHLASLPLLRLGFRPFYLLAATAGVVLMPLWLLVFTGQLRPASGLAPALWHGHEMLFGMFAAVIVGFLFTAGKTWTGLQTPRGAQLAFFALLWLSARVAAVLAPYPVFFFLDIAFLPMAAATFANLVLNSGNYRNLGVVAILTLLGFANLCFHLGVNDVIGLPADHGLHAGLALMVLLETLIAGRVIPLFTRNAVPGLATTVPAWRERALLIATAAGLLLWLSGSASLPGAVLLAVAAVLHLWRLFTWKPLAARGRPILWILHLAYAWIPIGLALLAVSLAADQPDSPALHALGVGAGAGLMLAMMTRSARGHTGRPLLASRPDAWSYRLILLAAVVRVGAPLLTPEWYLQGLLFAGLCFAGAFFLFLFSYAGWMIAPRADGRDD